RHLVRALRPTDPAQMSERTSVEDSSANATTLSATQARKSVRSEGLRSWLRWFYTNPRVLISGGFIILLCIAAIAAPLLTNNDPSLIRADHRLLPPGEGGLLGTDEFGRDLWARIIYGARL